MSHSLERVLMYTDLNDFEVFGLSETEHDELYGLFVTTKDNVLPRHISSTAFFNEVFYYITCIYANQDCAEHLQEYFEAENELFPSIPAYENPKTPKDVKEARQYAEWAEEGKIYIMQFIWFILHKQQLLPKNVQFFLQALDDALEGDNSVNMQKIRKFLKEHPSKYAISFTQEPQFDIAFILSSHHEWQEVTLDFDYNEVKSIVRRFSGRSRKAIIDSIKEALEALNKVTSLYSPYYSTMTHGIKANAKYMDALLLEELDEPSPHMIYKGFASYIIKDHDRVLNILMLVVSMGSGQIPLFVKFIKAFQQLNYIKADCFDNLDQFIKNTKEQFEGLVIDKTNIKKYIAQGSKWDDQEYTESIQKIVANLKPLL